MIDEPAKKPNVIITSGIVLLVLLLITSVMSYVLKFRLKSTKNTPPTPTTIISPSPTIVLKEKYTNPFAPTGASDKQYNNPFEQTNNPFDELTK